mmetsp:Transcript_32749/g.50113  ORF Transcript_32749/g.50113 Transcript_32749/m.50113 type:complete len:229 (+) Transcript_32749:99-785(+)|eukprot:CAMPEP_0118697776 /NCGR_PEP_ID=MMETSP0800-20121206/14747_1 /TAXON_ID=210618 ORGANISM="Striatella unipunctata, Strain CCMP2910" /NCGR_SAMPLE_ID=MMETSP0800 /ASSEMBLY_ACC=CAM_ASM_000638 /LENGTH=228 /DNA_ID=CAMNT_0006597351 /DNA_START=82 /DNA_END=768 /DNA_ORIENTATION=-
MPLKLLKSLSIGKRNKLKKQSSLPVPRVDESVRVSGTKWLALDTYTWTGHDGKQRKWDVATRTTKSDGADAVFIIPLLSSSAGDKLDTLLVEQFRPPMKQSTLEFPAGLIDKGETPEETALRELREETGFIGGTATVVSRELCMSPGLTNESVHVVMVRVDLDDERNKKPKVDFDDGESIKLKRVSLKDGLTKVLDDDKQNPSMPIMGLYLFALGLDVGMKMGKNANK